MGIATRMILAAALLLQSIPVLAGQNAGGVHGEIPAIPAAPPPAAVPEAPPDRGLRWKNAAVIGGIAATVGIYGATNWWEDGFSGSFHIENEGWFGQNTNEGGADKAGHAYGTYVMTRLLTRTFEAVGNDPGRALRLGTWTSLGVMTGVEVIDGFSKKYSFSLEDVVMNTAGVAFAVLSEVYPSVDALLDFRLLYQRPDNVQQTGATQPLSDYSGQTFLLVMKVDGIPRLREVPVVRYVEFEVGYNARGYEPNDSTDPQRRICYGVGINLSRLLSDTVFRGDLKGGKIQRGTDTVLEYLEVPWTAARTYRTF